MKTPFNFKNGIAQVEGEQKPSAFLSTEIKALGGWAQKISRRLDHDGSIKMIHQDQLGVVACHMEQDRSGHGQQIEQVAVSHSNLLASL